MDNETEKALRFIANNIGFGRHTFSHFIEAMKRGYASTPAKGTIPELPGLKTIEYRCNEWRVLDSYFVTPQSDYSGGSIVIWYGPVPVWMMQFMGRYEDRAIPCLKAALTQSFVAGKFRGGRGPEWFAHDGYTYINIVDGGHFLNNSSGRECIFGPDGKSAGWHRYQSVYMVGDPK